MAENFFGITDKGRNRSNNEDCFIAKAVDKNFILACVIDGVGGYEGGEIASEIAQETLVANMNGRLTNPLELIKKSIIEANEKIFQDKQKKQDLDKMACVITAALVNTTENKFYYAHVGDTRLYLLRDKTLVKITRDHSTVGYLEESGRLSEEAAMQHPRRNEISKALGFQPQIDSQSDFIEASESPFLPGDTLLICSDGLTDMINSKAIADVLNSEEPLETKGKMLIDAANEAGGLDNITLVLVSHPGTPKKYKATRPAKNVQNITGENITEKQESQIETGTPIRKKKSLVPILLFLVIALAGFAGWLYYNQNNETPALPVNEIVLPVQSDAEIKLRNMVNDSLHQSVQHIYLDSNEQVVITGMIEFKSDSVFIHGNNSTLIADSIFTGTAFSFLNSNNFISIENITFKNFHTALNLHNQVVKLNNVHFPGCETDINHQLNFADSIVTGQINKFSIAKKDSTRINNE